MQQKNWKPKSVDPGPPTLPIKNDTHPHTSGLSGQEKSTIFVDVPDLSPATVATTVPVVLPSDIPTTAAPSVPIVAPSNIPDVVAPHFPDDRPPDICEVTEVSPQTTCVAVPPMDTRQQISRATSTSVDNSALPPLVAVPLVTSVVLDLLPSLPIISAYVSDTKILDEKIEIVSEPSSPISRTFAPPSLS